MGPRLGLWCPGAVAVELARDETTFIAFECSVWFDYDYDYEHEKKIRWFALRPLPFALRPTPYAICPLPFALRPLSYAPRNRTQYRWRVISRLLCGIKKQEFVAHQGWSVWFDYEHDYEHEHEHEKKIRWFALRPTPYAEQGFGRKRRVTTRSRPIFFARSGRPVRP